METVMDFILGGSKITADGDCGHEIKTLAPSKKSYDQPKQHIKKQRHYFVPTKVHLVKAMVFPVVMDGCESWTIKKAEHQRIDASELWCWRRLLRVTWTARRSNQSILKEISPEYSLEGLMLKRKLPYFGHLMWRADSFEKTLVPGKIEGNAGGDNTGWDDWMASLSRWTCVWVSSGSRWRAGKHGVLQSMVLQRVRLSDWTELMRPDVMIFIFWMLSFKPAFLLSSFTFIKRFFSSSLLFAIRVVSSA